MDEGKGRMDVEIVFNGVTMAVKTLPAGGWTTPKVCIADLEKYLRRVKAIMAEETA